MGERRSGRAARAQAWVRAGGALGVLALVIGGLATTGGPPAGAAPDAAAGSPQHSATYRTTENWLCRPDKADSLCRGDDGQQDATVLPADGVLRVERWRPTPVPPADCFYVYGTVSNDPGLNSDLAWSPQEEGLITGFQAPRFGSACRVFAPVYSQVTSTALADGRAAADPSGLQVAYESVRDAFREYVDFHNHGRGIILVGHSQGASVLVQLLREEIEPDPGLRRRFVSAYLPGRLAAGLTGGDVGGSYASPLCTRFGQVGCVLSWSTYRATLPPHPFALFGRDPGPDEPAACTNPATLVDPTARPGDSRWVTPYLPTEGLGTPGPGPWVDPAAGTVTTPFVKPTRFVEAQCVGRDGYHWLEVTVHGDPADPRVDEIGGDMVAPGLPPEATGLHLLELNLHAGDLVRLAQVQGFVHFLRSLAGG